MPPKRMTMEEKRDKLLKIFQRDRTFFALKEIEKISSKAGINEKTFKDVLQSLLDDDLVICEKIGSSNYYWSFGLDEGRVAEEKFKEAVEKNQTFKDRLSSLKENIANEKIDREESKERDDLINLYNELDQKLKLQESDLSKFAECDPRVYERKMGEVKDLVKQINAVTDNIFCMQSYVCDQFNLERKAFYENFKIDEEMDYIE